MNWSLVFMILGVAYAATWPFKIVDFIERRGRREA